MMHVDGIARVVQASHGRQVLDFDDNGDGGTNARAEVDDHPLPDYSIDQKQIRQMCRLPDNVDIKIHGRGDITASLIGLTFMVAMAKTAAIEKIVDNWGQIHANEVDGRHCAKYRRRAAGHQEHQSPVQQSITQQPRQKTQFAAPDGHRPIKAIGWSQSRQATQLPARERQCGACHHKASLTQRQDSRRAQQDAGSKSDGGC
jgi:hypothetical protein